MFRTIGRTWNLTKQSWGVLQQDRELLAFPLLALTVAAAVIGVFAAVAAATGSLDVLAGQAAARSSSSSSSATPEESIRIIDVLLLVLLVYSVYFVTIFFNAALIAAAVERLRGGDPTIGNGIRAVAPKWFNILGWAIVSGTVGLLLSLLRSRSGLIGRMVFALVGGVWAYLTFFVVPYLVVQDVSPWGAIKESSSLLRRTWGEQVTAGFGFGLLYVAVFVAVFLPAAALFALSPIAGLALGLVLLTFGIGVVQALEGIFKAALFEYAAEGRQPEGFDPADLSSSYAQKSS